MRKGLRWVIAYKRLASYDMRVQTSENLPSDAPHAIYNILYIDVTYSRIAWRGTSAHIYLYSTHLRVFL